MLFFFFYRTTTVIFEGLLDVTLVFEKEEKLWNEHFVVVDGIHTEFFGGWYRQIEFSLARAQKGKILRWDNTAFRWDKRTPWYETTCFLLTLDSRTRVR